MKKYDNYKSSGVEWIGDIPEHWTTERAKWIFNDPKSRNRDLVYSESNLLSVSEYYGVGRRTEKISQDEILNRAESLSEYKTVNRGDLVINIMLAWKKGLGVSSFEGITSPSYCVFRLTNEKFFPKYFHYLYRTNLYAEAFRQNSTGIIESRLRLYPEEFFNILTIVPTPEEQTAIAKYLDEKTEQIDKLIANKRRLIELLKEERTAIINQSVTKGINEHAKLKPSGIDWLGDIPEHWQVKKIGNLASVTKLTGFEYSQKWITSEDGEIIALRGYNIGNGFLDCSKVERISKELSADLFRSKLNKNDIVYPCTGTIGNASLIDEDDKFHINQNVARITPNSKIYPKYLLLALLSFGVKSQIHFNNSSQMQPVILIGELRQIKISMPESIQEQIAIVNKIEDEIGKLDLTISKVEKEIELLQEYRTALISEIVTGKVRVI